MERLAAVSREPPCSTLPTTDKLFQRAIRRKSLRSSSPMLCNDSPIANALITVLPVCVDRKSLTSQTLSPALLNSCPIEVTHSLTDCADRRFSQTIEMGTFTPNQVFLGELNMIDCDFFCSSKENRFNNFLGQDVDQPRLTLTQLKG
jgi:hypothetical protein